MNGLEDLKNRLSSRKLWLSIIAAAVAFGNAMWDWGLTPMEVTQVIAPLFAFIGIEGLADIRKRK